MLSEQVTYKLYHELNTVAPRINSANVYVNGNYHGLLNHLEEVDDDFINYRIDDGEDE
eukprot:Pgem_evm1s12249